MISKATGLSIEELSAAQLALDIQLGACLRRMSNWIPVADSVWPFVGDTEKPIPPETVELLWNISDNYSLLNTDRDDASTRYGVSLWLWGDNTVKSEIVGHFNITS